MADSSEDETAQERRKQFGLLKGGGKSWADSDGRYLPKRYPEGHRNSRGMLLEPEKVLKPSERCGVCVECRGQEWKPGDIAPKGFETIRKDRRLRPDEVKDVNDGWARC